MILFEVDAHGYVTSTPSLIPQGMALSDIVIITESDYELVTLRLIPPSGRYIPDVNCTPVKTQDKSATLWQAFLPAEAAAMHGVLTYQIFRRNAQGRVIPTQEGALTVQRGVISDMPENVEHLGTYSIDSLYNLLTAIHAKTEDHDRGIDKNASDIDVLESARPVTGAITLAKGSWSPVPDGFNTSVAIAGNTVQSGDIVLVLPDDANTRIASADMEVRVAHDLQNGEDYDVLYFKSKTMPTEALYYRFIVVKKGATDAEMTANALIVGVNDVPKRITDAIAENKASISNINERLTTGGKIVVPKASWGDSEQNVAVQIKLKGNVLKPGTLMVLAPGNDATKQIVAEYGMSMKVGETVDGSDDGEDIVVLERKPGKIPEANLTFYYAVIVIGGNTAPIATLVGGLGGSGSGGEEFYVGEDEPPATATVWIDPSGDPTNTETWEFVMENGDTVTRELVVVDD